MKSIGEKVLGLFLVEEGAAPAPRAEPVRPPQAKPAPPAAAVTTHAAVVLPATAAGPTMFAPIYREGGVPDEDRERLAKVVALIESLPAEADLAVKRALVGASLTAFGVPIDGVIAAGNGAIAALDAHIENGGRRTREVLAQAEARIAKLAAEIEEARRRMDAAVAAQQQLAQATSAEKARVRAAVDFFGVPKSR